MATTVHQTYKLQTYTVLQGSTRPGWYLSWSSPETTAKHQISRRHNIYRIISTQEPISVFIFPSDYYRLEPTVTRTAPETISQLFPSVSALFIDSSVDILSRDTPAVTGWCPLLDIYRRTEELKHCGLFLDMAANFWFLHSGTQCNVNVDLLDLGVTWVCVFDLTWHQNDFFFFFFFDILKWPLRANFQLSKNRNCKNTWWNTSSINSSSDFNGV